MFSLLLYHSAATNTYALLPVSGRCDFSPIVQMLKLMQLVKILTSVSKSMHLCMNIIIQCADTPATYIQTPDSFLGKICHVVVLSLSPRTEEKRQTTRRGSSSRILLAALQQDDGYHQLETPTGDKQPASETCNRLPLRVNDDTPPYLSLYVHPITFCHLPRTVP